MISYSFCKRLMLTLLLIAASMSSATAQWLTSEGPQESALSVAGAAPSHTQAVMAWSFKGQIDVLGMSRDVEELVVREEIEPAFVHRLEQELGMELQEWLQLFSGSGYIAFLDGVAESRENPPLALVVELQDRVGFERWIGSIQNLEFEEYRGYQLAQPDHTVFGINDERFFIAHDRAGAEELIAVLEGESSSLADDPTFARAASELGVEVSGFAFYVEGNGLLDSAVYAAGMSQEHPAVEELALWDFAVLSVDFTSRTTDGLLGLSRNDSALSRALHSPGSVDGEALRRLPNGLTAFLAADLSWGRGLTNAVADAVPDLGFFLTMMLGQLDTYGQLSLAFDGVAVGGTDAPEQLGPAIVHNERSRRSRSEAWACGNTLESLQDRVGLYRLKNGSVPNDLSDIEVPDCPTAGYPTYQLRKLGKGDFELYCSGNNHAHLKPDHPLVGPSYWEPQYGYLGKDPEPIPSVFGALAVRDVESAHKIASALMEESQPAPGVECSSNLNNIATALDMYSTDWSGNYPADMTYLTPNYLRTLPNCPQAGRDTYSGTYSYTKRDDEGSVDGFKVHCSGQNHPRLKANHPRHDSVNGPEIGPIRASLIKKLAAPQPGESRTYQIHEGPQLVLDSSAKTMVGAYGERSQEFLQKGPGTSHELELVREALAWGGDSVIYLDYLDLEGTYQFFVQLDDPGLRDTFHPEILKLLRSWVGELRGVNVVKTTNEGLRYRGRGFASAPLVVGVGAGTAAFMIPNFEGSQNEASSNSCTTNLQNIGVALEMWATDNAGAYPDSLEKLTPDYLRYIPECPEADSDTYSESYSAKLKNPEEKFSWVFEVYCKGHHHEASGTPADHPRYTSSEGLLER